MSLDLPIQQRIESLARTVFPAHADAQTVLRSAIESLCTIAWCQGYRECSGMAQIDAATPSQDVTALAERAIKQAREGT